MKKTLLLLSLALFSGFVSAQKTWNFSDFTAQTLAASTTIDGLQIMAGESTNVIIDANNKVNGSYSFTQRCKLGGSGGFSIENRNMPTTRALVFSVSGPGTIKVAALSSSSSADRRLILTNGTDSLTSFTAPGTYTNGTDNIEIQSFDYTGAAATLYLYSVSSGVNVYLLDVSSAIALTGLNSTLNNKGVEFNGSYIQNPNQVQLEVYNALGKLVINSNDNIPTNSLARGVYLVKAAGKNEVLKFTK